MRRRGVPIAGELPPCEHNFGIRDCSLIPQKTSWRQPSRHTIEVKRAKRELSIMYRSL